MIDLTTLTPEQANKIECFLITCEVDIMETIKAHQVIADDHTLSPKLRETFASNAQWYRDLYHLIYQKEYTNEK